MIPLVLRCNFNFIGLSIGDQSLPKVLLDSLRQIFSLYSICRSIESDQQILLEADRSGNAEL